MATKWLDAGSSCDDIASIIRSGENAAIRSNSCFFCGSVARLPDGGPCLGPLCSALQRDRHAQDAQRE
jgi:hypothetical protein